MKMVFVKVKTLNGVAEDIAGKYGVEIDDDVPDRLLAGVALDVFHGNVPVDVLDDFEFSVADEMGRELTEPDDYEGYSGTNRGRML